MVKNKRWKSTVLSCVGSQGRSRHEGISSIAVEDGGMRTLDIGLLANSEVVREFDRRDGDVMG